MRPRLLASTIVAALAVLAGAALAAPVNLVANGSFEDGNYQPNAFTICECDIEANTPQATAITGWTVVAPVDALPDSGIDWLQDYPQYVPPPSDGVKNIDLSGDSPGAIEQALATTAGTGYTLTFDVGSNADPSVMSAAPHTLTVIAGPTSQSYSIPRATSGYLHESLHFTASSSSSLLEFISTDNPPTGGGPVIDDVVVTAGTGEPGSEDDCDNGGWMTLIDGRGNPFASAAACYAFATGTTLEVSLPRGGRCDNVTFTGVFDGSVEVPRNATCVLAPGAVITTDVTVRLDATLYVEGATVGRSLLAHRPLGVDMQNGGTVGRNLVVHRIQDVPAGEPTNEFCNLDVGGRTSITSVGPQAPIDRCAVGAAAKA